MAYQEVSNVAMVTPGLSNVFDGIIWKAVMSDPSHGRMALIARNRKELVELARISERYQDMTRQWCHAPEFSV